MRLELNFREGVLHRLERPPREELPDWLAPADHPEAAADVLRRATGVLDKNGIDYTLTDGSMLGHMRDDGPIAGDGDIDLRVDRAVMSDGLFADIAGAGLTLFKKVWFEDVLCNISVHLGGVRLDISGGLVRGSWMTTHAIFRDGYLTYRMPYKGREPARFLGVETWRPAEPEAYVRHCYGADWQVPATEWDGSFSHCALVGVTGGSDTLTRGLNRWLRSRGQPARAGVRPRRGKKGNRGAG